jgi:hypothetical protein
MNVGQKEMYEIFKGNADLVIKGMEYTYQKVTEFIDGGRFTKEGAAIDKMNDLKFDLMSMVMGEIARGNE